MRISDWSSDVCSSDLIDEGKVSDCRHHEKTRKDQPRNPLPQPPQQRDMHPVHDPGPKPFQIINQKGERKGCDRFLVNAILRQPSGDRKSVVEGKSVSVSVEIGGRRVIKKKQKNVSTIERRI